MNGKKLLIILGIIFILCFLPGSNLLAAKFAPLIFTSANFDKFDSMISSAKENSCVILQMSPELLDSKKAEVLNDWVMRGGTIWFYDSRIAHYFGMKEAAFKPQDLPCKEMKGEYGSQKEYPGIALGCEAWGNHNITIGVRKVMVFVLEVDNGMYSAVSDSEGVTPLLKIERESSSSISAIKNVGEGRVIFKPLLWEDKFDGSDFQRRMMNYSSRKSIPFLKN